MVNAHIHHDHPRANVLCQHVHAGSAANEIVHHLRRHLFRESAHAFFGNAVVAGERKDDLILDLRPVPARDQAITLRQLFEPAQAPLRLREIVEPGLDRSRARFVNWLDVFQNLLKLLHV